jgi:predicted  nucleic acid-binding Zn-ribbon protein
MDNKLTTREEIDNLRSIIAELKKEIKSLSDEIEKLKNEIYSKLPRY